MQSSGTATFVLFFGILSAPVFVNLADFSLTIFTRMLVYIQLLKQQ